LSVYKNLGINSKDAKEKEQGEKEQAVYGKSKRVKKKRKSGK
jgi:hypothetical protein